MCGCGDGCLLFGGIGLMLLDRQLLEVLLQLRLLNADQLIDIERRRQSGDRRREDWRRDDGRRNGR